jgi:hypothetical protein
MIAAAEHMHPAKTRSHRTYRTPPESPRTPHERLGRLRLNAGFTSARGFALQHDVNETTYSCHESGRRAISPAAAAHYAALLGVPPSDILFSATPVVPVLGAVVDGGRISRGMAGTTNRVAIPSSVASPTAAYDPDTAAVVVATSRLAPALLPGDVVYYRRRKCGIEANAEGRQCVVQTAAGERLLCIPHRSKDGGWTLRFMSSKRQHTPALKWAAVVRFVDKRASL